MPILLMASSTSQWSFHEYPAQVVAVHVFRGLRKHPCVEQFRVRSIELAGEGLFVMGDGEELGEVPVRVECVPESAQGLRRLRSPATLGR